MAKGHKISNRKALKSLNIKIAYMHNNFFLR